MECSIEIGPESQHTVCVARTRQSSRYAGPAMTQSPSESRAGMPVSFASETRHVARGYPRTFGVVGVRMHTGRVVTVCGAARPRAGRAASDDCLHPCWGRLPPSPGVGSRQRGERLGAYNVQLCAGARRQTREDDTPSIRLTGGRRHRWCGRDPALLHDEVAGGEAPRERERLLDQEDRLSRALAGSRPALLRSGG